MGVTAIKSISNRADVLYYVQNRENPNDTGGQGNYLEIYPGDHRAVNMWIPWCDNAIDFGQGKNILFEAIVTAEQGEQFHPESFAIWQSRDHIYYSVDDRFDSGRLVAGNATINGDRSVEVTNSEIRLY